MRDLVATATRLGLSAPRTVLATGNLVFGAEGSVAEIEQRLEAGFAEDFGKPVPIIVRRAEAWRRLVAGNPFAAEAEREPANVAVRVMRDRIVAERLPDIAALCRNGERVALVDGDLWVHFPDGEVGTRGMPASNPRTWGVGTARNWNTVKRLAAMLD